MTRVVHYTRCLAVLVALALVATACGSDDDGSGDATDTTETSAAKAAPTGPPIAIGVQGALSGPLSYLGTPILAGARTAADYINSTGGVNGHPLEILGEDDRADVPTATRIFQDFVAKDVAAVIGPGNSGGWTAISPIAQEQKIPLITTNNPKPIDPAQPYLFGAGVDSTRAAAVSFAFIESLAKKAKDTDPRIATLTLNTPNGLFIKNEAKKEAAKRSWNIAAEEVGEIQLTDFSTGAANFARAKPDYIYSSIIPAQIPVVLTALRSRGVTVPVANYSFGAYNYVFEQAKDEAYFAYRDFIDPKDPAVKATTALAARAKAAKQESQLGEGFGFTQGYTIVRYLAAALTACGDPCPGEKLNTALEGVTDFDAEGLAAPDVGYTPTRHEFSPKVKWYVWDNSKSRAVSTSEWIG